MTEKQQNNPLHGLKLETMIEELVGFYNWNILYAALRLDCFNNKPTVTSCVTFLKKTEWARERVENFYLYRFKRMPKANSVQFQLKPRERAFADGIAPRQPQELTVEIIAEMRAKATADYEAMKQNTKRGGFNKDRSSAHQPFARDNQARTNRPKPSQDPKNPWGK